MKNNKKSRTEEFLLDRFPLLMSFNEISQVTGINSKTLHNWRCLQKLPFKTKKVGGKWRVHVAEVSNFIDSFNENISEKRRVGRPLKSAQFED